MALPANKQAPAGGRADDAPLQPAPVRLADEDQPATAPADHERLSALARLISGSHRDRFNPWLILAIAVLFEVAFLLPLGAVRQTRHILGLPGSLMALTAVVTGVLGGPLVGAVAVLIGGAIYYVTVAGSGARGDVPATIISVALWTATALVSGLLADALRDEADKRRRGAVALAESHAVQESQIEVARLHASLEASLLPALPIAHPSLRILTAYRPSEARLQLGGDFFDVLTLPDGRLALIIGDVAGHGPQAAALGARLRSGWQALTLSGAPHQTILRSLDSMVADSDASGEVFATVCLAMIDTRPALAEILVAGHVPPLFVSDGLIAPLAVPAAAPLGVVEAASWNPATVSMPGEWLLFFYTDGLIEGRARPESPERFGEERLIERLSAVDSCLKDDGGLDWLLDEVEAANGGKLADDAAIVTVAARR